MEDRQKVYIQGNSERGDEVIKTLEDLGGISIANFDGKSTNMYYLINPDGLIGTVSVFDTLILPFIKEFYKEIELPRWKPRLVNHYYYITTRGEVMEELWYNIDTDNSRYEFGNCFKTFEEAEAARYKIKEMLTK